MSSFILFLDSVSKFIRGCPNHRVVGSLFLGVGSAKNDGLPWKTAEWSQLLRTGIKLDLLCISASLLAIFELLRNQGFLRNIFFFDAKNGEFYGPGLLLRPFNSRCQKHGQDADGCTAWIGIPQAFWVSESNLWLGMAQKTAKAADLSWQKMAQKQL